MTDFDDSHEPLDLVDLKVARNPIEAKIIASVLADSGIQALVGGDSLTDEFALSQRMMNLQGVTVQVRKVDLEAAQAALEAARKAGERLAEQEDADGSDTDATG